MDFGFVMLHFLTHLAVNAKCCLNSNATWNNLKKIQKNSCKIKKMWYNIFCSVVTYSEQGTRMPQWRNGRRNGLKIRRGQLRVGSNPTCGSKKGKVQACVCTFFIGKFSKRAFYFFSWQSK